LTYKKVYENHESVREILSQLPVAFMEKNGGASALKATVNADNYRWGDARNVDELVTLGVGCGYVEFLSPRGSWKNLPGGVPYFKVLEERKEVPHKRISDLDEDTIVTDDNSAAIDDIEE
jgi:hypothetical protein